MKCVQHTSGYTIDPSVDVSHGDALVVPYQTTCLSEGGKKSARRSTRRSSRRCDPSAKF